MNTLCKNCGKEKGKHNEGICPTSIFQPSTVAPAPKEKLDLSNIGSTTKFTPDWDSSEGQTHSYGDGCGEKAHNAPKEEGACGEGEPHISPSVIHTKERCYLRPRKEEKEPLPSSPNKTIEEFREKFPYLHDEYAFDEDGTNIETWLTRALNESHAAGMEEFRKKAIEAVTTVFKEISDLNIDGDEKYWKVEAFGYAPHDMEASKDKFFPKQVKEKLLAALNKLTP